MLLDLFSLSAFKFSLCFEHLMFWLLGDSTNFFFLSNHFGVWQAFCVFMGITFCRLDMISSITLLIFKLTGPLICESSFSSIPIFLRLSFLLCHRFPQCFELEAFSFCNCFDYFVNIFHDIFCPWYFFFYLLYSIDNSGICVSWSFSWVFYLQSFLSLWFL